MKKAVSMFLAAALAVGTFAGCGSSADTGSTGSAASTESGSTDSAAADGSVFKIGGIGPTTGAAAIYGSAVMNAAQIAVDEINEAGGINGYQVEFKAEDDQSDAEKSVNAYNSLKDWGMQVLMGTVTTTPCIAVADKTAEDGMFEITPSASSTDVIENDNVFQACFTDPNLGTASAQYIGENNLATKVAVIYDSSDVYSSGIYEKFAQEYKKMNEKLGLKQYLVPYLMSSHPGSTLKEAVELAEHLRDLGYMPEQVQDFYPTPSTISTCMYYTGLDPRTMEPVYVPTNPHEKAMQRALIQYRNPDNYDLVKEALIKAGREDLIGFDQKCLIKPRKMTKDIADRKKVGTRTGKKPGNGKTEGKGRQVLSGRVKGMAGQTGGRRPKPKQGGRKK